jgi:hypothetical protein
MGIGMGENYKISNIRKIKPNGYTISHIYTYSHDIWQRKYKKHLDTAISSWSGFVYQGKVAIYHVLKEIHNESYTLQLDSLDDFAIFDENSKVVSLHQVKAKKDKTFGAYKKAFKQLQDGGNDIGCQNLYFHLAREITNKTPTSIELDFSPIKVYMYGNNSYCSVDSIDSQIESLIIVLMRLYHADDPSKATPDYAEKVRKYLDDLVVKKLFEIHQIIHDNLQSETESAYTQRINFSEFIDILNKDLNQEHLGDGYYLYQIKSDICRYHQNYCLDEDNELSDDDLQKLNSIILKFKQLNKEEIISFIKNIMPHRVFKFNTITDYKDNTPIEDEIKEVFFEAIKYIKNIPDFTDKMLVQWLSNDIVYSPTTINNGDSSKNQKKVCKNIVKNALDNDLDVLFESDKLITTFIDVDEIASPTIIENIDYENSRNHIMQWKKVSLITIENAKGEIDD